MLKLPKAEMDALAFQVESDYRGALQDHHKRIERADTLYRMWRIMQPQGVQGSAKKSNFIVPMIQWFVLGWMARTMQSILGDDAEVVATAIGPSDQRTRHKVSRFMQWRVFESMDIVTPLATWLFRAALFGVSHAHVPYERRTFDTPAGRQIAYQGPAFLPIAPDDMIVPTTKGVNSIQDFPWNIHRRRFSPDELLTGEEEGRFSGIKENWDKIVDFAEQRSTQNDYEGGDTISRTEDSAEGVVRDYGETSGGLIEVHDWYGLRRLGKERRSVDLLVRFIPGLRLVIGVQRLMDLYPRMEKRRPFEDIRICVDGTYWTPGVGEFAREAQAEVSANHNAAQSSADLAARPPLFYEPGSGFNPKEFDLECGVAYPTNNAAGVNVVQIRGDIDGLIVLGQTVRSYMELVLGISDNTLGRMSDRPNQPRTATGQTLLAEASNVRGFLDTLYVRQAIRRLLNRFWMLDSMFAPERLFFRVTEDDAKGLFDTRDGGSTMTAEEFNTPFDFGLKFATSYLSREQEKMRALELYQIDLGNPLIVNNPAALWDATNKLHSALGDDTFAEIVPRPPDLGLPKDPKQEWTLMLQGEDVEPTPLDNDDLHLVGHYQHIGSEQRSAQPDEDAIRRMAAHIAAHERQKSMKMLMQSMMGQVREGINQSVGAVGDLTAMAQQNAGAPDGQA